MKKITVNDLQVAYLDQGPRDASPVILSHCSNASSREWRALMPKLLKEGFRVLAPDYCGYGGSDPWPDNRPFDPDTDINILKAMLARIEQPVHLVGHSYGGAISLEGARIVGRKIRALTLIEPVIFQLLHETEHKQWPVVAKMAARVANAVESGDKRKAAAIFTRFWIGPLKWWLLPERQKRGIEKSMGKVVHEFELIDLAHRTPQQYASVTAPVRLIMGTKTHPSAKAVGQLLFEVLPDVERRWIKAGHMSPFTHTEEINRLILEHLQSD